MKYCYVCVGVMYSGEYDVCDVTLSVHTRTDLTTYTAQLIEHWTSIPKVVGSIPTVVRQTFQLARCGCTLRVTSQTSSEVIGNKNHH